MAVLYTTLEPTTSRAELVRAAELDGEPEGALYPLTVVQIEVNALVVELLDDALLSSLGIEVPFTALVPFSQTQPIGRAALEEGIEALVVPSVAVPARNAVLLAPSVIESADITSKRKVSSPGRWPK
jgi:hypothetical protein